MNTKILRFIFLSQAILIGLSATSQDKEIKKADDNFKNLQYQDAIVEYTKAWGKFKQETFKKRRVAIKLAECYRYTNKPNEVVEWYGKVVDTKLAEKEPAIYFHYAEALRRTGNCTKATEYYNKYLIYNPDDLLGKNGLLSCEEFAGSEKRSKFIVINEEGLNSSYDDYAAAYSSKNFDELFFTSNREGSLGKEHENWSGAWFSDIYQSTYKNLGWEAPILVDETEVLDTEANEGTPAFNGKFSTLYFTRCEKGTDKKVYCQIMQSDRRGQRWTKPKTVLFDASSNTGQPWISDNELVIYFASDREGGQGAKDIWMAIRTSKGKSFEEAINLGSVINTPGDEMFPNLSGDSILYFSSDGHPGLGGLDLFRSTKQSDTWGKPENLLPPLNSNDDDFAIIFKDDQEGFLSSNRMGGLGSDDIYHFVRKKIYFKIDGTVKDERTLFTMTEVQAELIGSEGYTVKTTTNEQGHFGFDSTYLQEGKTYILILSKENFFSVSHEISTIDYTDNQDFVVDVLLKPIPEEPIVLPDILYDLGKWDLKPQYQDSLMVLVKILNDNPNLVIELRSHTDSRASAEFNDDLSQKRAQSVVDFLISKGVDPERLIAKGYGERVPRTLDRDFVFNGYTLKKGSTLTDQYVGSLQSNELKEFAYELNRRTEFVIIAKDYVTNDTSKNDITKIDIINDSLGMVITYTLSPDNYRMVDCYVNDYKSEAILDQENSTSFIGEQKVIELMRQGALSKENFEGNVEQILENNQVKDGAIVKIEKLRIGDKSLDNIRFTVRKALLTSLSLGQDILNRLGTYEIDDLKKQIIIK